MSKPLSPERCAQGLRDHAVSEHAHKLVQGWFLLHASLHYALPPSDRGQGKKSSATVALEITEDVKTPGFDTWLAQDAAGFISRRTAFNYMAAAKRAGLTLDMSEADALEAAHVALDKVARLSDLYKGLPAGDTGKTPSSPAGKVENPHLQMWFDFRDAAQELAAEESKESKALLSMPYNDLVALEESTRAALDVIKAAKAAVKKGAV